MWNNPLQTVARTQVLYDPRYELVKDTRRPAKSTLVVDLDNWALPKVSEESSPETPSLGETASALQTVDTSCYDISELPSQDNNKNDQQTSPDRTNEAHDTLSDKNKTPAHSLDQLVRAAQESHPDAVSDHPGSMLPPPLPSINTKKRRHDSLMKDSKPDLSDLTNQHAPDYSVRHPSSSTDISMHTGCSLFPTCTTEDE